MNIEVEIKMKADNLAEIREKVAKIGKLVKAIRQVDDYYTPIHRHFYAQKPHPTEYLRIRTNPDKTVFEYDLSINKRENGEHDYAEEYETEIKQKEEFEKILNFLDIKKILTVDKQREYWQCGNIEVALDQVAGLGNFVEAEAKGDFKDNKEAKQACIKFLEDLGFKDVEKSQTMLGYPEMIFNQQGK